MADDRKPYQVIEEIAEELSPLSDAEVLTRLEALPPLSDESDACWSDDAYWRGVAYRYLALLDVASERKLRAAVPLILNRACFGDPGEIMRGLCNAFEAIFNPDWSALTDAYVEGLASRRPGTRFWAAYGLRRLRDPAAIPALERAVKDVVPDVREEAASALDLTLAAQKTPE